MPGIQGITSWAIRSRGDRPREQVVHGRRRGATSGRNGSGCGGGGATAAAPQAQSRTITSARNLACTDLIVLLLGVLWVARLRGSGADGGSRAPRRRSGATRHRRAARPTACDLVRDRRVGLVTNQPAWMRDGVSDVVRLRAAGVRLVALFSPEHGFRGAADPGAAVASSVDSATGLPIYSLYGRTSAPTAEMLAGHRRDAGGSAGRRRPLLHLPLHHGRGDAGGGAARAFRWSCSTAPIRSAGRCRATCSRRGTSSTGGPASSADAARHDARGAGPPRTGRPRPRGRAAGGAGRRAGSRAMAFDATGLPFVPPSPNLRTLESLFHYPGTCLFEGTNLSVGRGSDAPFEQIGAPWLDTAAVLAGAARGRAAGRARSRGVRFTPTRAGRREVRRHPPGRDPARGHRPRGATTRPSPPSTF